MKNTFLLFLALLAIISCGDDEGPAISAPDVLVLNEGAFLQNNASIEAYNSETRLLDRTFLPEIGDILQDAILRTEGGEAGVIISSINNSNELLFINRADGSQQRLSINQPRYLALSPDNSNRLFLSSLDSVIYEIDIDNVAILRSEKIDVSIEDFEIVGENLYGAQRYSDKLHRISLDDLTVQESFTVLYDPASMVKDDNDHLWIVASGDVFGPGETGGIIEFNTSNNTSTTIHSFIDKTVSFSPRIAINPINDNILYTKDNLYEIVRQTADNRLLGNNTYTQIYGLGAHPITGDIYTADALAFDQRGVVRRMSAAGDSIAQFEAGIAPNGFIFLP